MTAGTRLALSLGPSFPPFSGAGTPGGRPRIRTTMSSPCLWGRVLRARAPGAQGTHSLGQLEGHLRQVLGLRLCQRLEGQSPRSPASSSAACGTHGRGDKPKGAEGTNASCEPCLVVCHGGTELGHPDLQAFLHPTWVKHFAPSWAKAHCWATSWASLPLRKWHWLLRQVFIF